MASNQAANLAGVFLEKYKSLELALRTYGGDDMTVLKYEDSLTGDDSDKMRISLKGNATLRKIFRIQKGRCALCGERLTLETGARCHKYTDGMRTMNYLVHPNCHRKIHSFPLLRPAYCGSNRL